MTVRSLRAALVILAITVVCVGMSWADPAAVPAGATQALADGRLNLNDPKVRERLKAAGIDPDELQTLMNASGTANAASATPQPANAAPTTAFPPVTTPPALPPANADSLRLQASPDSLEGSSKYFGYDVFALKPTTFEPLAFGPVSPDYLIGPGDEIIVSVWGAQEVNARATVNRDGYILLPDLGQIMANGFTLRGFKDHLEKRLARIYSGIQRDGRAHTSVEVSLGKLRSMQVFVLGDVVQPGGYTIGATSTVMNALYFAGGPTLKGSMRTVRVLRNNQILHRVDLYDYIASGDRSQDVKLENGDVVFVPPVSNRVTLEGEVQHPAIYELQDGQKLSDLLRLAGGLTTTAYRGRLQIERIIPFEERAPMSQVDRKVIDLELHADSDAPGSNVQLHDGDIVRVFRIRDILRNTVRLVGTAVYKPGTYQHREGLTVADLVDIAGGLLGDSYTGWAHLVRTRPDKSRALVSFNLANALKRDPKSNLVLEEQDEVQIFSVWDIRDLAQVSVQGLVRKPGKYELMDGMTVTDLIMKAGGLRESAYRVRAEVSRINPAAISEGRTSEVIYVAMAESLRIESEASRFKLQKNDMVFIREIPNWGLQENVWVTGEVKFPGMYTLTSKVDRLSSVIDRAGGLESTAYLKAATFNRKKDNTGRMAIDFESALTGKKRKSNKYDLVLAAGDSINIPREPKTVKVAGDVGFPSSVLWEDGRDMSYYVDQAGGLLDTANKNKMTVVMANGRVERPGFLRRPKPDAGATIVVPRKPEQKERETLKNFAQIISILSGAATTIFLISRTTH